ncbi:DEAD/DEAH box helicase family protein [bacterium]|nr:DEAD/DEAH box helicase family protein [bacterium]MBU1993356.1 DEAD/DEAH box helicase family protein [bacterium]
MNESETRAELIDPKLLACGWGVTHESKVLRERDVCRITDGRIQVGGGRAKPLVADYILVYKGVKLAVIEAKSDELEVSEGVAQAKLYAQKLGLETTYSTNGKEIYSICLKSGREELVENFLTPEELWNLKRDGARRPRILFLADRNILADQAFNSFCAFSEDALVRIKPKEIKKSKKVPTIGNIFFTIFQSFMSRVNEDGESKPYFGAYPQDYFDFIIIDECHRGGANDEGKLYKEEDFNKIIEIKAREEERVKIFMDEANENEKLIPTVLTTSQKLSTGVDAEKSNLFDVLEYVFNSDIKPISRETRVNDAKQTILALLNDIQKVA